MKKTIEIRKKVIAKVDELKGQLAILSSQIEEERNENNEEDSVIRQELLDKKDMIEQKILELQDTLSVDNLEEHTHLGKAYTLKINGNNRDVTLVHPSEANPGLGMISLDSPLGQALLQKKSGDKVHVETPTGTMVYHVM